MSALTRIEELCADRALFGLSPGEECELRDALEAAGLSSEADDWEAAAAAACAAVVGAGEVPPRHLLERLEADAHACLWPHAAVAQPRARSGLVWLAAAAVTIGAWLAWSAWDAPRSPSAQRAALVASAADLLRFDWAGEAAGDVVWSDAQQAGFMRFRGLPANDPSAFQYQLWIFDRGRDAARPVDGGVFDVTGAEVLVPVDAKIAVDEAFAFAVTIERPGGVVVSEREHIVATAGL